MFRRKKELTYGYQLPQQKGFAGLSRQVVRSLETMAWGSSIELWRTRCAASLKASRRRRGLDA